MLFVSLVKILPYSISCFSSNVAAAREPCPMGTYSLTGYPSQDSECLPCEEGQITLAVGSNHCITGNE